MNKKVSTLLVATLLAAGPAFTAAYAKGTITPVPYSATFKLNLADGVKFYLKGEAGKYFTAEEKTIDKQTVWTLGTTTESIADASVFEVRNFAKVSGGATFELYADGKKLVVSSETGNVVTELDKVISSFYSVKTTTEFDEIKTFAVNQSGNLLGGEKVTPLLLN